MARHREVMARRMIDDNPLRPVRITDERDEPKLLLRLSVSEARALLWHLMRLHAAGALDEEGHYGNR